MQVVLIILSVILLGVIINYAFSPKSSRILRLASLGAMVLIALSLGVASIAIVISGSSQDNEEDHLPIFVEAQRAEPNKSGNLIEIVIFLVILAALIVMIAIVYFRDKKKKLEEAKKASSSKRFPGIAKAPDMDGKAEEAPAKAKDDEFSLDLN